MEIRKLEDKEITKVVNLWYDTTVIAHNFISLNYWEENKDSMANQYLPNSETYLAIEREEIVGFISMVENYLAALFVKNNMQRSGIGRQLLNYFKDRRETIQLGVFKKNMDGVSFYLSQDFNFVSEKMDNKSNELVIKMEWNK